LEKQFEAGKLRFCGHRATSARGDAKLDMEAGQVRTVNKQAVGSRKREIKAAE